MNIIPVVHKNVATKMLLQNHDTEITFMLSNKDNNIFHKGAI